MIIYYYILDYDGIVMALITHPAGKDYYPLPSKIFALNSLLACWFTALGEYYFIVKHYYVDILVVE